MTQQAKNCNAPFKISFCFYMYDITLNKILQILQKNNATFRFMLVARCLLFLGFNRRISGPCNKISNF